MPTYTFRCTTCGHEDDVMHVPVAQRDLPQHQPECPQHGPMPRKTVTQTSFALKGSGWYRDGYK
jgi:putative FmdB family regulatory protein